MDKAILKINNLSTGYRLKKGDKVVAKSLCSSLCCGKLTCLLGPNGSGKSTLLRTLAAFQQPLSGEVLVDDRPINSYSPQELAHIISIVLTDNSGITGIKAYDVIAMGRSPYTGFWGRLSTHDKEIIDQSITLTGVESLVNRRMQTLSDGERQKVMIAKAIAQHTPIIMLDEPTAYLDYPTKVQTMLLLRRLSHEHNKAILLSTHDLEHAIIAADDLWLLDKEKGLVSGTPRELGDSGKIGEYFDSEDMKYNAATRCFEIKFVHN